MHVVKGSAFIDNFWNTRYFDIYYAAALNYTQFQREGLMRNGRAEVIGAQNLTAQFYALRSQVELAARMYQQALDDMHFALSRKPRNYLYSQECARIYLVVGQYENAVTYAQKSLDLKPDNSEAHRLIGLALQKLGREAEAQEHLKLVE